MSEEARSCWNCKHQKLGGGETFLGKCTYFATIGRENKDILPRIVDVGCKFWAVLQGDTADNSVAPPAET